MTIRLIASLQREGRGGGEVSVVRHRQWGMGEGRKLVGRERSECEHLLLRPSSTDTSTFNNLSLQRAAWVHLKDAASCFDKWFSVEFHEV